MSVPIMFRKQIYPARNQKGVLIFACPYGTRLKTVQFFINRFVQDGYTVVGYDFDNQVFLSGDVTYLPALIAQVVSDAGFEIKAYGQQGVKNIGVFGSSLGAFVMLNVSAAIPEVTWGVFNTFGDGAKAVWNIPSAMTGFNGNKTLEATARETWSRVQNVEFPRDGVVRKFLFTGSTRDKVLPYAGIKPFLGGLQRPGIQVGLDCTHIPTHPLTVTWGLIRSRRLVGQVTQD
jgi:hypothetical protein